MTPFADSIREFLEELRDRFGKPEPVEEWGAEDTKPETSLEEVKPTLVAKPPKPKIGFKQRVKDRLPGIRLRVFGVASILILVVNVAALLFFAFGPQIVAFIAVAYLVPNTLLIIHYRRLLKEKRLRVEG